MLDILIVEDNKEIGTLLCDFLRKENYVVVWQGPVKKPWNCMKNTELK